MAWHTQVCTLERSFSGEHLQAKIGPLGDKLQVCINETPINMHLLTIYMFKPNLLTNTMEGGHGRGL